MTHNMTKIVLLSLALALAGCAPVYRSRPGGRGLVLMRVALHHALPVAVVCGGDSLRIADAAHRAVLAPGECWTVTAAGGALAAATTRGTVIGPIAGPLALWSPGGVSLNGRLVAAPLELRPEAGGVLAVAELPLEDYVAGVVGAELGMAKPDEIEAAKAQAVAARSYASCKIGSKPGAGYDIEASVSEQAFDPARANPTVLKAVRQTAGQVLTCGGAVVAANYHSTCGGRTALASEAWAADDRSFPFIKSVTDGHCGISPRFAWQDSFRSTDIALRLLDTGLAVDDVAVTARGPSGRAVALRVSAQACDTTLYRDKIRFGLAERALPSTLFDVACRRDGRGFVETVVFTGTGYGHGVGMCQWGAIGMARKGRSYVRILKHYYRDVRIETLY